jgi:acyl-CoA reductase-like NAD-dependent aldehyde dehydrogenase
MNHFGYRLFEWHAETVTGRARLIAHYLERNHREAYREAMREAAGKDGNSAVGKAAVQQIDYFKWSQARPESPGGGAG